VVDGKEKVILLGLNREEPAASAAPSARSGPARR
jgi:hypothetical protein